MTEFYQDREQTKAKHEILRRYLESFAHKVVRTYGSIDFVDAFCGPWEERDVTGLTDTSIGIALEKLNKVAETLEKVDKPKIRCIFNEKDSNAFRKLAEFVDQNRQRFPLLEIHMLHGEFEQNAFEIERLSQNKFMLLFVDPTGWSGFSPEALKTLIGQRESEVIINFMRSFVERFLCPPGPDQEIRLAEVLGAKRAQALSGQYVGIEKLENELVAVLKNDFGFRFAASSPIHNPDKDQIQFKLFYATHHPAGMEVMRDSEFKALSEHDQERFRKTQDSRQQSLFGEEPQVLGPYLRKRKEHLHNLSSHIRKRLSGSSHALKFMNLRAELQQTHYLREAEIKDCIVTLANEGAIEPTWEKRNGRRPGSEDHIFLTDEGKLDARSD
ncbi:MAG: three-Cys-motif partner protein TcmP [Pseudomonadota bacterium]